MNDFTARLGALLAGGSSAAPRLARLPNHFTLASPRSGLRPSAASRLTGP
jgi:hypothetical protein